MSAKPKNHGRRRPQCKYCDRPGPATCGYCREIARRMAFIHGNPCGGFQAMYTSPERVRRIEVYRHRAALKLPLFGGRA